MNKVIKILGVVAAAAVVAFSITACGGKSEAQPEAAAETQVEAQPEAAPAADEAVDAAPAEEAEGTVEE